VEGLNQASTMGWLRAWFLGYSAESSTGT